MAVHGHQGSKVAPSDKTPSGPDASVRGIGVGDTVSTADHPDDCEVVAVNDKSNHVTLRNKRTGQTAQMSAARVNQVRS